MTVGLQEKKIDGDEGSFYTYHLTLGYTQLVNEVRSKMIQ